MKNIKVGGLVAFAEKDNFLFMKIVRRSIIVATTGEVLIRYYSF